VKFAYGMPFMSCPPNPAFLSGDALATIGAAAEAAGFAGAYVTDHPAPSEGWRQAGGHDALDPFVALAFIAGATRDLRLMTYLTILPYRNPFVLAKAAATLDRLSGGRLVLGLGAGYMKAELGALGVDFDTRNARFDEYVEVLKLAWTGEPVTFDGQFVQARGVTAQPTPAQQPHPPLWLGGNSKLTRRRAAAWAQGWSPMPNPSAQAKFSRAPALDTLDDLAAMIAHVRGLVEESGRTEALDIMYVLPGLGHGGHSGAGTAEQLTAARELAALGVTWLAVTGEGDTVDDVVAHAHAVGADVLARL
jgi:probable F420-dependent oxidoreductase